MKSLKRLLHYFRPYSGSVMATILSSILTVIFSILSIPALIPFFEILLGQEQLIIDEPAIQDAGDVLLYFKFYLSNIIIEEGKEQALIYMCSFILVLFFGKNLFRYLSKFFVAFVRNGVIKDLRQAIYNKLLFLSLDYFTQKRKGDLIARITADVQEVEVSILNVIEAIFKEPLMIIGSIGIMLYLSPSLTIFVLFLIVFTSLIIGSIGKVLKKRSKAAQTRLGEIISIVEETLSGIRIIKGFNAQLFQLQKFNTSNEAYQQLQNRMMHRRDLSSPLSEFLGISVVTVLIWYGFSEVQAEKLTVAGFLTFLYAFFTVIEPAKSFSTAFYNIQKGAAALERIEEILHATEYIPEKPNAQAFHSFKQEITFKNVSFFYNKKEGDVLDDINVKIPYGKIVALVGMSGSGKSTFINLIPRFYDTSLGEILIDGISIRDLKLADLRAMIAIVSQESILFNDTIYNNIVFGLENVTRSDVENAAEIANAHDFILATEDGYQTNIGDNGLKLSGGQRQRLTLARAVLRNPSILILDEATSSLDSASEKAVQDALQKVMQNRTAIVIAHRLSTIQHADIILVLKEGKLIEQGKHETLLQQSGEYKKLLELQQFSV